jgi:hypothetical protein
VGVDVGGGLGREPHRLAGDHPRLPRRQVALGDPLPEPGETVAQLGSLTEVALPGLGREPDRGGELRHTELRHRRRTGTGDGQIGLSEDTESEGRSSIDRLGRVHRDPVDREVQQVGLRAVCGPSTSPGRGQHAGGGVRPGVACGGDGHESIEASTTDIERPRNPFSTRGLSIVTRS